MRTSGSAIQLVGQRIADGGASSTKSRGDRNAIEMDALLTEEFA